MNKYLERLALALRGVIAHQAVEPVEPQVFCLLAEGEDVQVIPRRDNKGKFATKERGIQEPFSEFFLKFREYSLHGARDFYVLSVSSHATLLRFLSPECAANRHKHGDSA